MRSGLSTHHRSRAKGPLRVRTIRNALYLFTFTVGILFLYNQVQLHHEKAVRTAPALSYSASNRTSTVKWLTEMDLDDLDPFSGTWYMSMDLFLEADLPNIGNVEGASWELFKGRYHLLRMPVDWLDFSVEHMSKWWRILGVPQNSIALNFTSFTFRSYVAQHVKQQRPFPDAGLLQPTLALVAFQQFRETKTIGEISFEDKEITITSLAATLASLVQVGMGRILVVGYTEDDESVVRDSFRLLNVNVSNTLTTVVVHDSELVYVRATDEMINSTYVTPNLPRAALVGLRHARNKMDPKWTRQWLGDVEDQWKYVYLTEPDIILQTRPSILRHLKAQLDQNLILAPHRLQPIPYQGDIIQLNTASEVKLVPIDFKTPTWLNSGDGEPELPPDHCCDEQMGDYKPGREMGSCGNFWWVCGFDSGNHSRLEPYEFIRLRQGTGVTILAGTEHGRRCIPSHTPCDRRINKV